MGILQGSDGRPVYAPGGLPIWAPDPSPPLRSFGAMQARIADDMVSDAITASHIQNAIQDAQRDHERAPFWFNEAYDVGNFSFSAGKEYYSPADYAPIGSMAHIQTISVLLSANRYTLLSRTPAWMEEIAVAERWRGMPTDWCWVGQVIRLYPTPDQSYPATFTATMRWPIPVSATDQNPWLDDAEQMIRSRAKAALSRHITRDPGYAQQMDGEEARALMLLRAETTRRQAGPGRIRVRSYY